MSSNRTDGENDHDASLRRRRESGPPAQPLVAELVRRGHVVTGMTRSEAGAQRLRDLGASVAQISTFDRSLARRAAMVVRVTWGKLRAGSWDEFERIYRANVITKGKGIKGLRGPRRRPPRRRAATLAGVQYGHLHEDEATIPRGAGPPRMRNREWSRGESNPRPLECDVSVNVRRLAEATERSGNIGPPGPPSRRLWVVFRRVFTDRTPTPVLSPTGTKPHGVAAIGWAILCACASPPPAIRPARLPAPAAHP